MSSTCRYKYRDLNPASAYVCQKKQDRELMVRLPNSTGSSYFNLLLPLFFPSHFPHFPLVFSHFSSVSTIPLLHSLILPLKYILSILSIGGSTQPKDFIEVIRNDLDAVREKIAKLKEKRDKKGISDPMYMIMSQEIIALTNKEVEFMKAHVGTARNYLS